MTISTDTLLEAIAALRDARTAFASSTASKHPRDMQLEVRLARAEGRLVGAIKAAWPEMPIEASR